METSVGRISVFAPAVGTLRKPYHAGIGTVIGNGAHNAQTRPTMRAIGEGITVTTIAYLENIRTASRTHGRIRHNSCVNLAGFAGNNAEIVVRTRRIQQHHLQAIQACQRGNIRA